MANFYAGRGLEGFAAHYLKRAGAEVDHAMLFRQYLLDSGQNILLLPLDAPSSVHDDFELLLKEAHKHEKFMTASIHNIYDAALNAKDYRSVEFLNRLVKDQGTNEKEAAALIKKYELFAGDGQGLYRLDRELALGQN
ncbi:MAG: ferritin [Clostridiales bacterium]|jgi:ferritin|nr:ferritin [Clostridiales bacterium]